MNAKQAIYLAPIVAAIALVACGAPAPQPAGGYSGSGGYSSSASYYGTVESVEGMREGGNTTGAGAVIGGIAGGVLGHQIGSGRGNTAATIGGAVGGAVIGNEVEKRRATSDTYRFRVRMDDGSVQIFTQNTPSIRAGDRVRVDNGSIVLY